MFKPLLKCPTAVLDDDIEIISSVDFDYGVRISHCWLVTTDTSIISQGSVINWIDGNKFNIKLQHKFKLFIEANLNGSK